MAKQKNTAAPTNTATLPVPPVDQKDQKEEETSTPTEGVNGVVETTKANQIREYAKKLKPLDYMTALPAEIADAMIADGVAWAKEDREYAVGYAFNLLKQDRKKVEKAKENDLDTILERLALTQEWVAKHGGKQAAVKLLSDFTEINDFAGKVGGFENLVKFAMKCK